MDRKHQLGFWLLMIDARILIALLIVIGLIADRYTHHAIRGWLDYWFH